MGTTILPRYTRDRNEIADLAKSNKVPICERPGSLVDYRSHHFVPYLVLSHALKEAMGGNYPPGEEIAIANSVWTMVVENDINFSVAKSFSDSKCASSRKHYFEKKLVLDSWWSAMQWTIKNRLRREP